MFGAWRLCWSERVRADGCQVLAFRGNRGLGTEGRIGIGALHEV